VEVQRLGNARRASPSRIGQRTCKQSAVLARRDRPVRKQSLASLADLRNGEKLLAEIQDRCTPSLGIPAPNTHNARLRRIKKAVENGFAFSVCGSGDCEGKIKEETRATMRCIPLDQEAVLGSGGVAASAIVHL